MTDPLDSGASKDADVPREADAFRGAEPPVAAGAAAAPPAPAPGALAQAPVPRPRSAWRFVRWWFLVTIVLMVACAICAGIALSHHDLQPVHVIIDGEDAGGGITIDNAGLGVKVLLALAAATGGTLVLMLVPVVLMLVAGVVALALAVGVGLPVVAVALVLALLTSPLWLIMLVVWFLARRRRAFAHATSATIAT